MIALKDVLVQPVQTEKTVGAEPDGKYTFLVHSNATKPEVKAAVKEFYGSDVISVNISTLPEKTRMAGRGRTIKRRKNIKKAIITLASGKSLDFNAFK
ncbi:50S ribosomal protein L23 [bacterium]|jgi:large subunit ribosomal protein L23|nr:50S ribosomal protein L23 [bacterium]MBT6832427.1 50S ribosomal protein L23 [bacterium]MBT6996011.1 50S ribosomal protein L23 [bacterium]MBT7772573.1 50S ribosomal protein L23 [bacterium]